MSIFIQLLSRPELFHRVAKSDNYLAEIRKIGQEMGANPDYSEIMPTEKEPFPARKKWEIFSRIRFEYVRPFCTKRQPGNVARVAPCLSEAERDYGLRSYFWAAISPNVEKIKALQEALAYAPEGSLGAGLAAYYAANDHLHPGTEPSMFPTDYIVVHDLHHVLTGLPTTDQGEIEVTAFESGMLLRCPPPILIIEQLEILLEKQTDIINSTRLLKAWNSGCNAAPLFSDWDWLSDLHRPLAEVRQQYNVVPLD